MTADARLTLDDEVLAYLKHLSVERRLAARSLCLYEHALRQLTRLAREAGVALPAVQTLHVRRWVAKLHAEGLGSRSLALSSSSTTDSSAY